VNGPRTNRQPQRPRPASPDPLAALITAAADDPATDPRVREWLSRLLNGDRIPAAGGEADQTPTPDWGGGQT
jgi:hypothetical protein